MNDVRDTIQLEMGYKLVPTSMTNYELCRQDSDGLVFTHIYYRAQDVPRGIHSLANRFYRQGFTDEAARMERLASTVESSYNQDKTRENR